MRTMLHTAILAIGLVATAAVAQQPATNQQMYGPMMYGPMMHGPMMGRGMMGSGVMPMMGMMDPTYVDGRLAFLKTELKISEAQTTQWAAFADTLRANAKRMGESMNAMMSSGMMGPGMMSGQTASTISLPERIGLAETYMSAHLDALRAMKTSATQLYAVLSGEQKRLADSLFYGPMGMMGWQ